MGSKQYPLLISFYTKDWCYPDHARRLEAECEGLGLDYRIVELPSTKSYLRNTCLKPQFILDCFADRPLLWVDVDASIYRRPDFFLQTGWDFQAKRITTPNRIRTWHVGTMYFEPNETMRAFMLDWINNLKVTDESALEQTWRHWQNRLKTRDIPATYFEIEPNKRTDECVIYHRLSLGEAKGREFEIAIQDEIRNG